MRNALTISLPESMAKDLDLSARRQKKSRSQLVQAAVQRMLFLEKLDLARKELVPLARKQGIYTDEDVFKLLS